MARKQTPTLVTATAIVETIPTVATRKRARRVVSAPSIVAALPPIDLTQQNARKVLSARFPAPTNETILVAGDTEEKAALRYIEARDAEARAKGEKEHAGNVLLHAIGSNLGIAGDGWCTKWPTKLGNVNWSKLCKDLAISDETIAKYRESSYRAIDVRETAE